MFYQTNKCTIRISEKIIYLQENIYGTLWFFQKYSDGSVFGSIETGTMFDAYVLYHFCLCYNIQLEYPVRMCYTNAINNSLSLTERKIPL